MKYFTIDGIIKSPKELEKKIEISTISTPSIIPMICHRGLDLRVWSNNQTTIKCLCPPSYYGDQCQYHFNVFELPMTSAMLQDTQTALIIYVIIFIGLATIGLLNNIFSLITFIRESIRITVCGVYLIIFSLCNIILI